MILIPFLDALDFFRGLYSCIPLSVREFVIFVLLLLIVVAVIRVVTNH